MKLLISGAQGQLGLALQRRLQGEHAVVALDRRTFDLADAKACRQVLMAETPDVLLNCAAYTAVDRAESEPGLAHTINALGPEHLAQSCRELGIFLVHFSTDYVFDGTAVAPYTEAAMTGPTSVYGRTKLEGEIRVAEACQNYLIARLSWVYSNDGANFYKTMLRLGRERPLLRVVADQFGTPNFTDDLADAMACAIGRPRAELDQLSGLYHVSAIGHTSWFDFARAIFDGAGMQNCVTVESIVTSEYPTAAMRPAFSALDSSRFMATFGWAAPHWQQGLQRCLAGRTAAA